jgi:hypothetical protein
MGRWCCHLAAMSKVQANQTLLLLLALFLYLLMLYVNYWVWRNVIFNETRSGLASYDLRPPTILLPISAQYSAVASSYSPLLMTFPWQGQTGLAGWLWSSGENTEFILLLLGRLGYYKGSIKFINVEIILRYKDERPLFWKEGCYKK